MEIVRLNDEGPCRLDHEENGFTSNEVFDISLIDGEIRMSTRSVEQFTKSYESDDSPAEGVESYGALVDGTLAGKIELAAAWNGLGSIEQIVVAREFRQHGIATELITFAKAWALEKQLKGLRLETQTNNVAACKLYFRNGFEVGGFDKLTYRTQPEVSGETALYLYWFAT
ncbi:GNAT family N-acetyltransferase [Duganella sp. Root198D2]|uniref:GNAT family N-acetyltransferase n=1 Tax=Duganella sp. Root198D2 TaxID=1736489 RepID=UPI00070EA5A8|nr:GNAT family N-acetyltransferase [Duganella sp. Root198D2]KRB93200.1 hypothetical protein ASE26_28440 [Duganella sp. Root198D2]